MKYQVQVQGILGEGWLDHFDTLSITHDGANTIVCGCFADQAGLRGLLNWLWDLNCTILSVNRVV